MGRKIEIEDEGDRSRGTSSPEFKVDDRRHWARSEDEPAAETSSPEPASGIVAELRTRAETAERKLQEYSEAYRQFRAEQEQVRQRLTRDVERRVDLRFAELVRELVDMIDDLDLALSWTTSVPEAERLAQGVELARNRFVSALERAGVERFSPDGARFDPEEAEAVRVDPVRPESDGVVTETLRPGYRLRESLVRPARVAVGRARSDTDAG